MTKTFSMHKIKVILNDYFSKVEKQRIRVVLSASHQKDAKTFDKENWYVHAYYEKKEKMFGHTEKVAVTIYEKEILDIITTLLNAFEIETMFFTYPIRTSGYPVGLYLSFSRKIEEGQARQLNQKGGN